MVEASDEEEAGAMEQSLDQTGTTPKTRFNCSITHFSAVEKVQSSRKFCESALYYSNSGQQKLLANKVERSKSGKEPSYVHETE